MPDPAALKYTKDHTWIALSGDRARVGITDHGQKQLGEIVYFDLPEVGATLKQGQSFGTVESVKAVSELYAPIAGEVVQVNPAVQTNPEAVNTDPYGSWLIVLRVPEPAHPDTFLDSTQYADLVK
jgi:glycine cleavage system H protein